jgi:hypothetical protein
MVVASAWRSAAAVALVAIAVGACTVRYRPCPVDGPLPADAFVRCRDLLRAVCGPLAIADAEPLRLQTEWYEVPGRGLERRASVAHDGEGLGVVVEARWLRETLIGAPEWSEVRVDRAAERELAERLAAALASR